LPPPRTRPYPSSSFTASSRLSAESASLAGVSGWPAAIRETGIAPRRGRDNGAGKYPASSRCGDWTALPLGRTPSIHQLRQRGCGGAASPDLPPSDCRARNYGLHSWTGLCAKPITRSARWRR
jgi:hypothetical protein